MDSKASVPEDAALTGKIALVTGGAQGIGRAIAEVFQQAGMCVCLVDCDTLAGEASAAELTGNKGRNPVVFIPADLAQTRNIDFAVSAFAERFGRIDVLVNNAAVELDKSFAEISSSDWDRVQAINLRAPFLMTQQLVPYFPADGGSVINVSSIHASHAFPNSIAYASSKGGLVSLTRNLALELGPAHIRVNALCPGYIDTRLWEEYLRSASDADLLATQVAALHPLGRRGSASGRCWSGAFSGRQWVSVHHRHAACGGWWADRASASLRRCSHPISCRDISKTIFLVGILLCCGVC